MHIVHHSFLTFPVYAREGEGGDHHTQMKNHVFSISEHPIELRPVCKLEFVRCDPEHSICLGLAVAVQESSRLHLSKSSSSVKKAKFFNNQTFG